MRLRISRKSLRRALQWTHRILLAGAISLLGYSGFVLVDAWRFQSSERSQLDHLRVSRQLTGLQGTGGGIPALSLAARTTPRPAVTGDLVGLIEIPRLGVSAIVVEGTTPTTLRRAVGHIVGTTLPGRVGNVGISGHRDTFFRPLRNIQRDDVITLTTPLGAYRYHVVSTKIVSPNDVGVLALTSTETLTLVTCYPFYFVGAAPGRFIVRAEREPTHSEFPESP